MELPTLKEAAKILIEIHRTDGEAVSVPMLTKLKKDGQPLWIAGTRHTKDSGDAQAVGLERFFDAWLAETDGGIVCLEGKVPVVDDMTIADAVIKFGEGAIFSVMGQRAHLPVVSIEPGFADVAAWALEIMPDAKAFAAWALLNLLSAFTNPDGTMKEATKPTLTATLPKIGVQYGFGENADEVYAAIAAHIVAEGIAALPPSLNGLAHAKLNADGLKNAQKAGDGPHPTNRAAAAINLARDYGLLCNTLAATEDGQPVIVWTGLNHAISQLPAFEALGFKMTLPGK